MKKGKETETKIIQSALVLFVRQGYHGTSIREITNQVGITKAAFYAHFNSKAELMHLILKEQSEILKNGYTQINEDPTCSALDKIHRFISFSARLFGEKPEFYLIRTLMMMELKGEEAFQYTLRELYDWTYKYIGRLIQEGINQGFFKKNLDPDLVTKTFISAFDGLGIHWYPHRNEWDGLLLIRTFRKMIINSLLA